MNRLIGDVTVASMSFTILGLGVEYLLPGFITSVTDLSYWIALSLVLLVVCAMYDIPLAPDTWQEWYLGITVLVGFIAFCVRFALHARGDLLRLVSFVLLLLVVSSVLYYAYDPRRRH